jgi:hypothetical protein
MVLSSRESDPAGEKRLDGVKGGWRIRGFRVFARGLLSLFHSGMLESYA